MNLDFYGIRQVSDLLLMFDVAKLILKGLWEI